MATYQASTKAAGAPDIEADVYDGKLVSVTTTRLKVGKFVKDTENGDPKLEWNFSPLDDDGNVIREDREDNENFGKAIVISKLTGTGFNIASKTTPAEVLVLKALLTADEFAAFENGEGTPDDELDVSKGGLLGRVAQVEVFVKENGWPGIGNVVKARKARRSGK